MKNIFSIIRNGLFEQYEIFVAKTDIDCEIENSILRHIWRLA